ncbi:unnamed protein product [Microthlaspi erraticum]|uniref:Uncharacterized protein n=1 Tax=Microthlaspi erraticum TaxID=1685480 RepID=A0A6D2IK59_9BRAS|nr:unnamed protein product [Microthlaspi erraticum]
MIELRIIKCKANELYFQNFSHTHQSNRKTLDSTYTMHSNNSHPLTFNYFRTVNQPLMHFKVLAWLKGGISTKKSSTASEFHSLVTSRRRRRVDEDDEALSSSSSSIAFRLQSRV